MGGSISGNTINQIGASPNSACAEWHGIYQKFPHTTIQNNIISNVTSGWGMQFGGFGCYTTVSGNTFFKNEQGNIILYVETWSGDTAAVNQCPAATFSHVAITNNISIDVINSNGAERGPGIATFGAFCSGTVGTDNVIKNFLSYGNAGGNFKDNCSPATGLALLNIFSDASETATFTNWQANGSGTYSLLAGSNAIRNGSTTCPTSLPGCYPTTDITGANRSIPISIGAYDFSILPPPTAPNNFSIAGNITTSGYIGQ